MSYEDDYSHLPVGSVVGGYEILGVLGSGGFGVTYLAVHQTLDRKVALKECLPVDFAWRRGDSRVGPRSAGQAADFEWAKERFLLEARTLDQFKHENVVHIFDVFKANGTAYMPTGYVEGQDLEAWLKGLGRPPTEAEILPLLEGILAGLSVVHAGGVLHRDIKPENIYVTDSGKPVLLDFGSARQFIGGRSRSMTSVLTPGYAPPEQYYPDGNQGTWTDIYGLCATLHRCLCGESPPDGSARDRRGRADPYEPLSARLHGQYSESLLSAIDAGLDVDEEKRPSSVEALRALLGLPRSAKPAIGSDWTVPDLGLKLKWISPGSFQMGSPESEEGRGSKEGPQHRVALSKGFWLGAYEVTQGEWEALMGSTPSYFKGARNPVEQVSYDDALSFCSKLTDRERSAGRLPAGYEYGLPTEVQWEYACRAGTIGPYAGSSLDALGWYYSNSGSTTHAVGEKLPNAWGLYDMHGNVMEWCLDWYGDYPSGSVMDPSGAASGSARVIRGGCWGDYARNCRSADRRGFVPESRSLNLGFRLSLLFPDLNQPAGA